MHFPSPLLDRCCESILDLGRPLNPPMRGKPKAAGGILPILTKDMANQLQWTASARASQFG